MIWTIVERYSSNRQQLRPLCSYEGATKPGFPRISPDFPGFLVILETIRNPGKSGKIRVLRQLRMNTTTVVVVSWRDNVPQVFNSWVDQCWDVIAPADLFFVFYFSKTCILRNFRIISRNPGKHTEYTRNYEKSKNKLFSIYHNFFVSLYLYTLFSHITCLCIRFLE